MCVEENLWQVVESKLKIYYIYFYFFFYLKISKQVETNDLANIKINLT